MRIAASHLKEVGQQGEREKAANVKIARSHYPDKEYFIDGQLQLGCLRLPLSDNREEESLLAYDLQVIERVDEMSLFVWSSDVCDEVIAIHLIESAMR